MVLQEPLRRETYPWGSVDVYLVNAKASPVFYQELLGHLKAEYGLLPRSRTYDFLHRIEITDQPITVKVVRVNPKTKLSLAMHHQMEEAWLCIRGIAIIQTAAVHESISVGSYALIHPGTKHRLSSLIGCEILEVTYGEYRESDIILFQD
jgi:mannose-6-phosphate isomerase-like protein (cupin superfamily)